MDLDNTRASTHALIHDPLAPDTHRLLLQPPVEKYNDDFPLGIWPWHYKSWPIPLERHPLSKTLQRLALPKWTSCSFRDSDVELMSTLNGASLGTTDAIDLAALRPLLVPSPFGFGSKTIYDDNVRKGLEVTADNIHFVKDPSWADDHEREYPWNPFLELAIEIQSILFPERPVKLVFYKLALYEPGGHFQFHRDTTHTDSHHGTVVIGCDVRGAPQYKHGEFVLTADGEEAVMSLHAGQAVAFYTDVQHAVTPVTGGPRATLQFDIYLEDDTIKRPHTVACTNTRATKDLAPEYYGYNSTFNRIAWWYGSGTSKLPITSILEDFVSQLQELFRKRLDPGSPDDAPRTVAFLLDHLYRQRSIRREYLKGADSVLLHAIEASGEFVVFLHPVVFFVRQGWEKSMTPVQRLAICSPPEPECVPLYEEPLLVLDRGGESREYKSGCTTLGNDSGPEYSTYFAGAMFIALAPGPQLAPFEHESRIIDIDDLDDEERRPCTLQKDEPYTRVYTEEDRVTGKAMTQLYKDCS